MAELTDYRLPASPCPYCGSSNDGALEAAAGTGAPTPGALGICAYCAGLCVYDDDNRLRLPTDAELLEIRHDAHVARARDAVLEVIRKRSS